MKATPKKLMETVLQVRGGVLSASEAAQRLNVSRKTYYEWEARALSGMLAALQPRLAGRPAKAQATPLSRLQEELDRTKAELEDEQLRRHIRDALAGADTRSKKKHGSCGGHGKAPTVA